MKWLTLQCYLRFLIPDLRGPRDVPPTETVDAAATYRRAVAVNAYGFLWLGLEATALALTALRPTGALLRSLRDSRLAESSSYSVRDSMSVSLTKSVIARIFALPRRLGSSYSLSRATWS